LRRSNPFFLGAAPWIASRSLSSGAHSRDPLARNDDLIPIVIPAQAGIQYSRDGSNESRGRGVLDRPVKPDDDSSFNVVPAFAGPRLKDCAKN
jgi:hypothetical protein